MEVVHDILNNKYKEEYLKYASYVSMSFFIKNLRLFNDESISMILNDENLSAKISAKSSYELLENAINHNQIFTKYSKKWFNNVKSNVEVLDKYLKLLLNSHDVKQIKDFCNANPILSKKFYQKNGNLKNYDFERYVIGNNPELINQSKLLSETDFLELFNENLLNYDHVVNIFNKFSYKTQSIIGQETVNNILKSKYNELNKQEKEDLIKLISYNPVFFLTKLKELDSTFTNHLLKQPGIETKATHPKIIPNVLQSIVDLISLNKVKQSEIKEVIAISLLDYKDILFKDVIKNIGSTNYEYNQDYFLYVYETKNYNIFRGLSYFKDELNEKQKDIVLKGILDDIFDTKELQRNSFNLIEEIRPLLCFEYNMLENIIKYCKDKEIQVELINEVSKFALNNKLTESLSEKPKGIKVKI